MGFFQWAINIKSFKLFCLMLWTPLKNSFKSLSSKVISEVILKISCWNISKEEDFQIREAAPSGGLHSSFNAAIRCIGVDSFLTGLYTNNSVLRFAIVVALIILTWATTLPTRGGRTRQVPLSASKCSWCSLSGCLIKIRYLIFLLVSFIHSKVVQKSFKRSIVKTF